LDAHGSGETVQGEYRTYLTTVTKEAGFAFSGRIFGLLFGFFAQAVLANLLGADLLGVFVLAWTVVQGVTILTTLGFEGSLVRYISMYVSQGRLGRARSAFVLGSRISVVASIVCAAAVVLFRHEIAHTFFKEPRLERALLWIALAVVPFTMMRLFAGALRGLKDIKRFILGFDVSHRVFRLAAFLILHYVGLKLLGIVGAAIVATTASALLLASFLRRRGSFLFEDEAARATEPAAAVIPAGEIVVYSSAMLADAAMAFAMQHSDRLILGYFLKSADVAVYNIGALIASLTVFVLFSFNMIFSPVIADVYHRDRVDLLRSLFRSVTRWVIIFTLPMYAWILAAGEATLSVFGEEFVRGYVPLALLATGQMASACTGSVGITLAMTGHQKYNVYNAIAMAVVSIGLNTMLVPRMGIAGAGIATGTAYFLINLARLIEVRILLGITPYDRATLKVIPVGIVVLGLAYLSRRLGLVPQGLLPSALAFVVCAAVVAVCVIAVGIKEEDKFVIRTVLARLRRTRMGA
jgi:O-antigen/teichoic acid export membrane protein